jgi:hypothetical protein
MGARKRRGESRSPFKYRFLGKEGKKNSKISSSARMKRAVNPRNLRLSCAFREAGISGLWILSKKTLSKQIKISLAFC